MFRQFLNDGWLTFCWRHVTDHWLTDHYLKELLPLKILNKLNAKLRREIQGNSVSGAVFNIGGCEALTYRRKRSPSISAGAGPLHIGGCGASPYRLVRGLSISAGAGPFHIGGRGPYKSADAGAFHIEKKNLKKLPKRNKLKLKSRN